jgi:adenine phosphoribosyltransferase
MIRRLINPAFPTPTRSLTDITLVMEQHAEAFRAMVLELCRPHRAAPPDVLVCIESCGYLFGAPMAFELACPMVLARRAGKLPHCSCFP